VNKQLIALSLTLLVVPACRNRKTVVIPPAGCTVTTQAVPTPAVCEPVPAQEPCPAACPAECPVKLESTEKQAQAQVHEEVDPFTLEEEESLFNKLVDTKQTEEDIALESQQDARAGDIEQDSARYGFKRIYYDFNEYGIRPDQEPVIERNLAVAKDLTAKDYKLILEGHACNSAGSTDYNMMLSEKRAQSLADYFEAHGINKKNIQVVGRGSEMRIVPFGNREQQAPNRRVEIYAYKQKDQERQAA
jgi:outer membrane protein OmpA-like peptidoglycan-associated protein